MLLAPLLLTLPLLESVTITAVYAAASTIYPVIGILAASILGAVATKKGLPYLTKSGAGLMIGIGIYYTYKFWTYSCPGGF